VRQENALVQDHRTKHQIQQLVKSAAWTLRLYVIAITSSSVECLPVPHLYSVETPDILTHWITQQTDGVCLSVINSLQTLLCYMHPHSERAELVSIRCMMMQVCVCVNTPWPGVLICHNLGTCVQNRGVHPNCLSPHSSRDSRIWFAWDR